MKTRKQFFFILALTLGLISLNTSASFAASARRMPTAYVIHTYGGATRAYQEGQLSTWETLTSLVLTSITTVNVNSSGTTLSVADTTVFENCELGRSTISVDGQILTIEEVVDANTLTVSEISGTITSGTAVQSGFVLECYADSASYTDNVDLTGATTTSSFFRVIKPADGEGHSGTSASAQFIFTNSNYNSYELLGITESYSQIQDIVATCEFNSTYTSAGIFRSNVGTAADNMFIGCIAYGGTNLGTGTAHGFTMSGGIAIDCISENNEDSGFDCTTNASYIYNSTIADNAGYGFVKGGACTPVVKNNVIEDNALGAFEGADWTKTTNTEDAGVNFVDQAGADYHLAQNFAGPARNRGTDLSADPVFAFNDDIDGNTITRGWAIGADWYAPTQSSVPAGNSRQLPDYYYESTYGRDAQRGYDSLSDWETDTTNDLVTQEVGEVLTCYNDAPDGPYDDSVSLGGATTDANYFRVIRAADGQRGTRTSGVRFEHTSTATYGKIFQLVENYASVYDIYGKLNQNGGISHAIFWFNNAYTKAVGCFAEMGTFSGSTKGIAGFSIFGATTGIFINNVSKGFTSSALYSGGFIARNSGEGYFYNNTVINCHYGFSKFYSTGTSFVKNNIISNCTDAMLGSSWILTTNATSGVTFNADGYHLEQGIIGSAVAQGTDLSADPNFAFNDDIDGTTITRAWAIGADWYAPTANSDAAGTSRKLPDYYYESTYGDNGGKSQGDADYRDYTSLSTWEQDTDFDLTVPTVGFVLTAYDDAAPYDDSVTLDGATTDADYFRVIRAADGQRGTPTSGVRFEVTSSIATIWVINTYENYNGIYDIGVKAVATGTNLGAYGILVYGATGGRVVGCYAYDCVGTGTNYSMGIRAFNNTNVYICDCVSDGITGGTDIDKGAISIGRYSAGTANGYVYNNTIINSDVGIKIRTVTGSTVNVYYKNNIIQGNSTTTSNTGAGTAHFYPTTNATSGVTFDADGYHLASDDAGASGGTDLTTDPDGIFSFNDDIDGDTRPTGALSWDKGADEYIASGISISGTSDMGDGGTVAVVVNGDIQAQTGTISGGTWSIADVAQPSADDIITVFVSAADEADESTAVAKYDGTGNITGMVLNQNVLTIGSDDNQSLSITNLGQYDNDDDEDIMHTAGTDGSGTLTVDADTAYSDETIVILGSNTLTVTATETITAHNVTIAGTLTSGGASTYNVSGDWDNNGTFTQSTSTVTFNGTAAQTVAHNSGNFGTVTVTNSDDIVSFTEAFTADVNFTCTTAGASMKFNNGSTYTITGDFTLTGGSGDLITVTSVSGAATFSLDVGGSGTASYTNVAYCDADAGNQIDASDGTNTDSGNNSNWDFSGSGGSCAAGGTASGWYNSAWGYRKKITIGCAMVSSSDQSNFPTLIYTATDADLAADAQNDFDDVVFTASNGTTELDHEIEDYDPDTGELTAWVEIPTVADTTDTVIYMYYGNGTTASMQDVSGTWDEGGSNNYKLVSHDGGLTDSTTYGNNGSEGGSVSGGGTNGKIGFATLFDGSNDYIEISDSDSLDLSTGDFTFQAWIKYSSDTPNGFIFDKGFNTGISNRYIFGVDGYNAGINLYLGGAWRLTGTSFADGSFHKVDGVRDSGDLTLYDDGNSGQTGLNSSNLTNGDVLVIGQRSDETNQKVWSGVLDEIRISNVPRTVGWLKTEYNNQSSPATYLTFAAEEEAPTTDMSTPATWFGMNF